MESQSSPRKASSSHQRRTSRTGRPSMTPMPSTPRVKSRISSRFSSHTIVPERVDIVDRTIVLEIGDRIVRAGFAGQPVPVATLKLEMWKGFDAALATGGSLLGDHDNIAVNPADANFRRSFGEEVSNIIFEYLLVSPKNQRIIVVCDFKKMTLPQEDLLYNVFLEDLYSDSLITQPSTVSCCLACGVHCGLVIDMGWKETVVTAVYDYREIAGFTTKRSSKMICEYLSAEVPEIPESSGSRSFAGEESLLESSVFIEGNSDKVTSCIDLVLFASGEKYFDDDEYPIPQAVNACMKMVPLDVRKNVIDNIIFIGSLSQMKGLRSHILKQIRQMSDDNLQLYSNTRALQSNDSSAWKGTSLYISSIGWILEENRVRLPGEVMRR